MKFPLTGPSSKSTADESSYQRSLNFHPIPVGVPDANGSQSWALIHSEGLAEIDDMLGQKSRGIFTAGDRTYQVVDNKLYSVTVNLEPPQASHILVGTLLSSFGPVRAAFNPTQLIIVDGTTNGYVITLADNTFTTINATNHFYGGTHVVCYDGYFVYNVINTSYLRCSAINDGLTYSDLDVASAENNPDGIVGLAVSKGELWVLGTSSIEVWYDAANAVGFPLSPHLGAGLTVGCGAGMSILNANNLTMFLDDRGFIVQSQISPYIRNQAYTYELKTISTLELQAELAGYFRIDDAIAMTYNDRGRVVYQITFPTAHTTWVYDLNNDVWSEKSFFSPYYSGHREHLAQYHVKVGQLDLVCGIHSGKLYITDHKYYTDSGSPIHRIRICPPLRDEGKLINIGVLWIKVSISANVVGEGSDPQITLRYSGDGRHTWSNHLSRSLGLVGNYAKPITWNRLGTSREYVFEFSTTEPIPITMIEGYINNNPAKRPQ